VLDALLLELGRFLRASFDAGSLLVSFGEVAFSLSDDLTIGGVRSRTIGRVLAIGIVPYETYSSDKLGMHVSFSREAPSQSHNSGLYFDYRLPSMAYSRPRDNERSRHNRGVESHVRLDRSTTDYTRRDRHSSRHTRAL